MHNWIDGTLYPDTDVPDELPTLGDRVDFLARPAWDFGLLPDRETVEQIRQPDWLEAVEATWLVTSPTYHLLRSWHRLPVLPYLGRQLAYIRDDPNLEFV